MSEIKTSTSTYMVNGRPVSKEEYDKHQAEQAAWAKKTFGEDSFFKDNEMVKANQAEEKVATDQAKLANPVPDPSEVKVSNEDLKSPAAKDSVADQVTLPKAITEGQTQVHPEITPPEDNKLFNPSRLELLWDTRMKLSLGKGLPNEILTNALSGFNHRIVTQQLPVHRQIEGYAFITRPDINLSLDNIANSRFFSDLAAAPIGSVEYATLAALDAECPLTNPEARYGTPCYSQVPFDNLQAFVPIMSNTVKELSGFPDQTLDVWMSEEGAFREQYGMVDSVYEVNNAFTLNATFANTVGEATMLYIRGIMEWASGVRRGIFKPKTYNQVARRIDYQSRIYIFKFDPLGKRIINWGAAMVAWPMNDNEGSLLNHSTTNPVQDITKELNIQFQCIGARYRDTLLFESFNEVVSYFNPDLVPSSGGGGSTFTYDTYVPMGANGLVEVPQDEMHLFNWRGYPIIDVDTRAFRWYVPIDEYYRIRKEGGYS